MSEFVGRSGPQDTLLVGGTLKSNKKQDNSKNKQKKKPTHKQKTKPTLSFVLGVSNNPHHIVGLVVKASASGAEDLGFESRLRRDFSGSSHTSDFKIGTPVATLPGAWQYRVSAGTGWLSVSILWLER